MQIHHEGCKNSCQRFLCYVTALWHIFTQQLMKSAVIIDPIYLFIHAEEGRDKSLRFAFFWSQNMVLPRAWWKRQPDVDRRPLSFSTGLRRPDWAFLLVDVNYKYWPSTVNVDATDVFLVDVDQTEVFYWLTSTRLRFLTGWRPGRRSMLSTPVDAVNVHFTDVFITPVAKQMSIEQQREKNNL